MRKCRWLKPRLAATIDYLERTAANHLRHPMFAGLTKESLPDDTVIDGEIIAYGEDGRPSSNVLQSHRGAGARAKINLMTPRNGLSRHDQLMKVG